MATLTLKNDKSVKLKVGCYNAKQLACLGLKDCTIVEVKLCANTKIVINNNCDDFKYINNKDCNMKKCVCINLGCKAQIIVKNACKPQSSSTCPSTCKSSSSTCHSDTFDSKCSSSSSCSSSEDCQPSIALLGVGGAGSYLLNKLSNKYLIKAFEAGIDRRNDGFTYNLAIGGPSVHNQEDIVAVNTTYPPANSFNWTGVSNTLPWARTTPVLVGTGTNCCLITSPTGAPTGTLYQGVMLGGTNETINGIYVNPSKDLCERWAHILDDKRYSFCNLFPKLENMENFRSHTPNTVQTWDGTTFQPLDGPSELGSDPIHRGYDGSLQIMQAAPSTFALSLSEAIYNYYVSKGYNFKQYPIVDDTCSVTINSGTNLGVTTALERGLDVHRTRTSTARSYLNNSVMQAEAADVPANIADGGYATDDYANNGGVVNKGPYVGINGHNFTLNLEKTIQRIVFETKAGYPAGDVYWSPNFTVNTKAFKKPLRAIGVEYVDNVTNQRVFVSSNNVLVSLGTLATPIVLMQSGIGPKALLQSLSIPVLYDQPNMGKHITGHIGATLKWTSATGTTWGAVELGTEASQGFLPGPTGSHYCGRKFEYNSFYEVTTGSVGPITVPPTPLNSQIYAINLYDLFPKSTGYVTPTSGYQGNTGATGGLLGVNVYANYYQDKKGDDIKNICYAARQIYAAVIAADPTAEFFWPGPNTIFAETDLVLWQALMLNFVTQPDFVGSCAMSPNKCFGCVDTNFLLRGTCNVYVCDTSATPLYVENKYCAYPVSNDGEIFSQINAFSAICAEQLLEKL